MILFESMLWGGVIGYGLLLVIAMLSGPVGEDDRLVDLAGRLDPNRRSGPLRTPNRLPVIWFPAGARVARVEDGLKRQLFV